MFRLFLSIACCSSWVVYAGASSLEVCLQHAVEVERKHSPSEVTVKIRKDLLDNVLYYAVLVSSRSTMESPTRGKWNGQNWPDLRRRENAGTENGTLLTYQTTPVKWKPRSDFPTLTFDIGTGECDTFNYCNHPLRRGFNYALKVRAFTKDEFKDTDIVYFDTVDELPVGFVSLVLGGIFLAGAISAILSTVPLDVCFRLFSDIKLTSPPTILFKSYSPGKFKRHASDLLKTTGRLSNEFHLLGTLSSNLTTPSLHAQRIDNREKNRYGDVLPFDVTRVELSVVNGDPTTDYINASYIKGYRQQVTYIAAQGPKKETCYDFYRMVLEQKVGVIVMVTDFEENGTELCYRYFPEVGSSMTFNDIQVYCKFETDKEFCVRRKLVLKSFRGEAEVVHLHFEGWPDFDCPDECDDVVKLCEYTREIGHEGFTLVHGNAGIGRTGTFIALDILLQRLRNHDKISVFKTVLELRQQRVNMVQTLEQYAFIYKCISGAVDNISGKCKITEL